MTAYTSHVDTFTRDRLPPRDQWPEFVFDLPEVRYPERVNCASVLLDDALAEGHGRRAAVHSASSTWTYEELLDRANRIANVLVRDLGVVPGNRVLLRAPNQPMLMAAWLAVIKAGGVAVTTMPMLRHKELATIAERAHVQHALCDARLFADLETARSGTGLLGRVLRFGDGELEARMAAQPSTFDNVATARDDVCVLAFTSGTTGKPKATMHFHRDVLAMADVVARHLLRTAADDVHVGSPPLGFTYGLGALLVFPLRFRGASALVEQPSPQELLGAIERHRATCLFTAPTMYRNMLGHLRDRDLGSLSRCASAGEPLPKGTSDAWYEATGLRIVDAIGSTEMMHCFIGAAGEDVRPGATGRVLPGYRACLLDERGEPLPPGSSGRLAIKGPTGCRYLDDPRQADYVVNGWNVTGDRYRLDADGYYWFEARTDDMIVSAGYNIAGPEVEAALLDHPAVRECAVIGAPDADRGQVVKAFVVVHDAAQATPEVARALQEHVKSAIAPYKYPRAVEFVTELPKTATGKVQRSQLRAREAQRTAGR
jgi:2-aminobenzoate-CoA ligase